MFVAGKDWSLSNLPREVVGFYRDGEWSVCTVGDSTLAADEEKTGQLCAVLGTLVVFWLDSPSCTGGLTMHEKGRVVRAEEVPNCAIDAMCFVDTTDWTNAPWRKAEEAKMGPSGVETPHTLPMPSPPRKEPGRPWWKFWK